MSVVDVFNIEKVKISEVELKDAVFGVPVNSAVLHQVVTSQLAAKRAGTASAKNRAAVNASGKKLYRQKGTGRARVGDAASPTRRGGGVIFGPSPRKYVLKVPKKVRRSALRMAISDKVANGHLFVVDALTLPEGKTKGFAAMLNRFDVSKALFVTVDKKENLERSSRNVRTVKVLRYEGLNVYDVLKYEHLFVEQPAIEKIEEALSN
jgi:large subunit ribosomal protein L4